MLSEGGSVAGKQLEVRGSALEVLMAGEQGLGKEQSQKLGRAVDGAAWLCTVNQLLVKEEKVSEVQDKHMKLFLTAETMSNRQKISDL